MPGTGPRAPLLWGLKYISRTYFGLFGAPELGDSCLAALLAEWLATPSRALRRGFLAV